MLYLLLLLIGTCHSQVINNPMLLTQPQIQPQQMIQPQPIVPALQQPQPILATQQTSQQIIQPQMIVQPQIQNDPTLQPSHPLQTVYDNKCQLHPNLKLMMRRQRQPRQFQRCFDRQSDQHGICLITQIDSSNMFQRIVRLDCILFNRFCFKANRNMDCQRGFFCQRNGEVRVPNTNYDGVCIPNRDNYYYQRMKKVN